MEKRNTIKQNINFASSNGIDTIQAWFYTAQDTKPKAIVQIAHGMCEYIERYDDFASFLVENGYFVCANDHLGHGETSKNSNTDGFFSQQDGDKHIIQDMYTLNALAKEKFPQTNIILLGHSMGSFFSRKYAQVFPDTISALVLSGTGGPNPISIPGMLLTKTISMFKGKNYRSQFAHNIAFKTYCSKIENSTSQYDWVTNDLPILEKYKADPKCTFIFTVGAFFDLAITQYSVNKKLWANSIDKNLPIYIFSGDMDPVGDYGEGVTKVYKMLEQAKIKDLSFKLYPDGLHEMINAPNRHEVYMDILTWLDGRFQ